MDEIITVRPTEEANLVPMPARIDDEVTAELKRQGINVSWVYRNLFGAIDLGLDRFEEFEEELTDQGYKDSCYVLEAHGEKEDLKALISRLWEITPEPAPFQPTPDAIARGKGLTFFRLADELEQARKKGNKAWIDEVEFNLLPMWPGIIDKINAGCEYCYANDNLGGLAGLTSLREDVIGYMLEERRISKQEAIEYGLEDAHE